MPRVLFVEDDPNLLQAMAYILEREGFSVTTASSGETALASAIEMPPDVVVLDVNLPGIDGYEVCARLRKARSTRRVSILMLTARREVDDVLHGLNVQADDYVAKPCDPRVLVARLQTLLRRAEQPSPQRGALQFDHLRIDPDARDVWINGAPAALTRTEFDLLYLLASHKNQVFTRDQILNDVRAEALSTGERAVDVQVLGLRRKLQGCAGYIETVRGVGYKFSV